MFWCGVIYVGFGVLPLGLPGIDFTTGMVVFGAMQKVVLGPARVIRQLENRAHSHSRELSLTTDNCCRHAWKDKSNTKKPSPAWPAPDFTMPLGR